MKNIEKLIQEVKNKPLPTHVGIIMDGNRRWGEKNLKNKLKGHNAGDKSLRKLLKIIPKLEDIKIFTFYTFSLENLKKRPEKEKNNLYRIFKKGFNDLAKNKDVHKHKMKISVLGDIKKLPKDVRDAIKKAINATKKYKNYFLNFCIVYDGQEEIVNAVKKIIKKGIKKVDKNTIKENLYTKDFPAPEFIIRTGMEDGMRLSGFLLWDSSYSEFYFTKTLWPDFTPEKFIKAIKEFQKRNRRFGA